MFSNKTLLSALLAGSLSLPLAAAAQPQVTPQDQEAMAQMIFQSPAFQGLSPMQIAQIINSCPGLNGQLDAAALQAAMQNCPALNDNPDLAAFAEAAKNCPALNNALPVEKRKCPALENPNAPDPSKCPAFGGHKNAGNDQQFNSLPPAERKLAKKADARMQSVVKNLERNKRSADALIQAAREAGADPNSLDNLEQMSEAFRQVFMQTVSPEQIIESIFSTPQSQDNPQGFIIMGPDGSQWLVAPGQQGPQPAAPEAKPAKKRPQTQTPQDRQLPRGGFVQTPPPGGAPAMGDKPQSKGGFIAIPPQGATPMMGDQPQQRRGGFKPAPAQDNAPVMNERPTPPKGPSAIGRPNAQPFPPYAQQKPAQPKPQQAMTPPPGMLPPQGMNQQQGMTPPPGMLPPQGMNRQQGMTPPPGMPAQGMRQPKAMPQQNAQQAPQQPAQGEEVIIMEETITPMPLWPTKDELGKDGVLKYLQKRGAMMGPTI